MSDLRSPNLPLWEMAIAGFLVLLCVYPLRPTDLMPLSPTTEDAYYLLTVARNVAGGNGISYDGETPTNGVQPAAAMLYAPAFLLAPGSEPIPPLRVIQILQLALFVGGALLCGRLAVELSGEGQARRADRAGILLWLGSYAVFRHAVNGLETGLYLFCLQAWLLWQLRHEDRLDQPWTALGSGLLLGVVVLARIDAVFLVVGACLTELLPRRGRASLRGRAISSALIGLGAGIVSAPWWLRNLVLLGDLMPTSGRAEAFDTAVALSLQRLIPAVTHGLLPVLPPVAMRFSWTWAAVFLCASAIAWGVLHRVTLRGAGQPRVLRLRRPLLAFAVAGAGWACFYTLLFGAPHFVERYLIPLAVPVVPLTAAVGAGAACALEHQRARLAVLELATVVTFATSGFEHVVTIAASPRITGSPFYTYQYQRLASRIPPGASVGAFQSGTLGYFRPGAVNLDGKVNSDALRAREKGELWLYVRSRRLDYLVDWPDFIALLLGPEPARHEFVKLDAAGGFELWRRADVGSAP